MSHLLPVGTVIILAVSGDVPVPCSTSALHPMAVIRDSPHNKYINSVCITPTGAWLISYTSYEVPGGATFTQRSADRGRTWSDPVLAYDGKDHGAQCSCEMGQLLVATGVPLTAPLSVQPTARIYQFHVLRDTKIGARFGRLIYTISRDDGQTWSGPDGPNSAYAIEAPGYGLSPASNGWHLMAPGRILSTGEFLLPMNIGTDPPALADIRSELVFMVSDNILAQSDLHELRFEFHPPPPHGVQCELQGVGGASLAQEPQVVELPSGRLMCVMRTGNGCLYFTTSGDHGRTWAPTKPLRFAPGGQVIPHPNAACPFTRLTGDRYALLFCNNDGTAHGGRDVFDHTKNRNPVYVAVGREVDHPAQPMIFSQPRLLCSIDDFRPEEKWRDLTYGQLLEDGGEYFHFYNAVWRSIQVNRVDPRLLEAPPAH